MAKRCAEHMEELEGPLTKKVDWSPPPLPPIDRSTAPLSPALKSLDFSGLSSELVRLINEAVDAALVPDSKQPILLDLIEGDRSESVAYWPTSRAVGVWLLQALALLKQQNITAHYEFVAALSNCLDAVDFALVFHGYCDDNNNSIKCQADLGRFCGVLELDEESMEPDEYFVTRASLATHLYHQQCYLELASCCSSSSSDDEEGSESDEQ